MRKWLIIGSLAAALLSFAAAVPAAEVTRESYRAEVEPICRTNAKANERILAGVRKQVKEGKLKAAGTQFAKAARALDKALRELQAVPRPSADRSRLAKWLGYVQDEVELFERAARQLKAGDKRGAQRTVVLLTHTANVANNQVLAFEFTYCRLDPSRFT